MIQTKMVAGPRGPTAVVVAARSVRKGEIILVERALVEMECLDFFLGMVTLRRATIAKKLEKMQLQTERETAKTNTESQSTSSGGTNTKGKGGPMIVPALENGAVRAEKFCRLVTQVLGEVEIGGDPKTLSPTPSATAPGDEAAPGGGATAGPEASASSTSRSAPSSSQAQHEELDLRYKLFWEHRAFNFFGPADQRRNFLLHAVGFPVAFAILLTTVLRYFFGGGTGGAGGGAGGFLDFWTVLYLCFSLVIFFFVVVVKTELLAVCCSQGVYETASKLNHSFTPNAAVTFVSAEEPSASTSGGILRLVALRNIPRNEEIGIDYLAGPRYAHLSDEQRREILKQDYGIGLVEEGVGVGVRSEGDGVAVGAGKDGTGSPTASGSELRARLAGREPPARAEADIDDCE